MYRQPRWHVPLANVASLVPATGPTKIERYNRVRQIMITGNIAKGGSLSEALQLLNDTVKEMDLPVEYSAALVGVVRNLAARPRTTASRCCCR